MKKILSLALAVAMVLSLASVAFAADEKYAVDVVGSDYHKIPSKKTFVDSTPGGTVSYGNTIYYPLFGNEYPKTGTTPNAGTYGPVVKYDAVKGIKIATDWAVGGDWVTKTEIVKKRFGDGGEYSYFLAISFKAAPTKSETTDVVGEITLKKTSGDNKINRDGTFGPEVGETDKLAVDIELKYTAPAANKQNEITDGSKKFTFGDKIADGEIPEDEEFEFIFLKWSDASFIVNTIGQGSIVLKATADYNADIAGLYPEANLDFFIGNGATFNKTGEMFIPAEEGSFIYEIKNGVLVAIKGAEYDEYDEGFYFKTRTLGQYVVSDVELDLAAAAPSEPGDISVVEPGAPGVVVNPSTGAAL